MLGFFPTPYPNELFYSIISRYHQRIGNNSFRNTLSDVFGRYTSNTFFPKNLDELSSRIIGNYFTPDKFINEHSLFPIIRPFITEDIEALAISAMRESYRLEVGRILGISKRFTGKNYYKYCNECIKEDSDLFGEPYWHREHQLPGYLVCVKHKIPLIISQISIRTPHFRSLSDSSKDKDDKQVELNDKEFPYSLQLAKDVNWLLNGNNSVFGIKRLQSYYQIYLKQKGFLLGNNRFKISEITREFKDYFGEDLLLKLGCCLNKSKDNWLSDLVVGKEGIMDPVRHLLLLQFLGVSLENFFNDSPKDILPFGKGPWLCLNPAAEHYMQEIITEHTIKREHHELIGYFFCKCGFSYTRLYEELNLKQDNTRIRRVISYGDIWENRLSELLNQGLSLNKIGRVLQVSGKLVGDHIKDSMKYRNTVKKTGLYNLEHKRMVQRNLWLKLVEENLEANRNKIINKNFSLYKWLYHYDREWLNLNSPRPKNISSELNERENIRRDKEMARKIIALARAIRSKEEKHEVLTTLDISRELGIKRISNKTFINYPLTREAITKSLE